MWHEYVKFPLITGQLLVLVVVGCSSSEESDPVGKKEPAPAESPAELLDQIVQFDVEIRAASESDSLEDAHGALHNIGTAIEKLRTGIETGSIEVSDRDASLAATERLIELFGEVDATLHGKEGKLYSEIVDDVTTQLAVLKGSRVVE